MKSNLFIPKKLKIGFQKRNDTFTGKLAYVIYYDEKNKLRKETSWESWRDKKIDSIEIDNIPQTGFTLNKSIQRHNYYHWGSGRSVIRVWDPRDFEFEISTDNLIGILMHADVSKRDIQQDCVFAWYGTELVLLPTNSQEYKDSIEYTEKQDKKFSAKSLVPGYTYSQKKNDSGLVYLGYFPKVDKVYDRSTHEYNWTEKDKRHWFHLDSISDYNNLEAKSPSTFSDVLHEEKHDKFAEYYQELVRSDKISKPIGLHEKSISDIKIKDLKKCYYGPHFYLKVAENTYAKMVISDRYSADIKFKLDVLVQWDGSLRNDSGLYRHNRNSRTYYSSYGLKPFVLKREDCPSYIKDILFTGLTKNQGNTYVFTDEDYQCVYKWIADTYPEAVMLYYELENGNISIKGID